MPQLLNNFQYRRDRPAGTANDLTPAEVDGNFDMVAADLATLNNELTFTANQLGPGSPAGGLSVVLPWVLTQTGGGGEPVASPTVSSYKLGDSRTAGFGTTGYSFGGANPNSYPAQLQNLYTAQSKPYTVYNKGISGETTTNIRNRLAAVCGEAQANTTEVKTLTLFAGINNFIRAAEDGTPTLQVALDTAKTDISFMVGYALANGFDQVIVLTEPKNANATFNPFLVQLSTHIRALASDTVVVLDLEAAPEFQTVPNATYIPDGTHPNDAGSGVVAGLVKTAEEFAVARIGGTTLITPAAPTFADFTDTDQGGSIRIVPASGVGLEYVRYRLPGSAVENIAPANGIIAVGDVAGTVTAYSVAHAGYAASSERTSPAFTLGAAANNGSPVGLTMDDSRITAPSFTSSATRRYSDVIGSFFTVAFTRGVKLTFSDELYGIGAHLKVEVDNVVMVADVITATGTSYYEYHPNTDTAKIVKVTLLSGNYNIVDNSTAIIWV